MRSRHRNHLVTMILRRIIYDTPAPRGLRGFYPHHALEGGVKRHPQVDRACGLMDFDLVSLKVVTCTISCLLSVLKGPLHYLQGQNGSI